MPVNYTKQQHAPAHESNPGSTGFRSKKFIYYLGMTGISGISGMNYNSNPTGNKSSSVGTNSSIKNTSYFTQLNNNNTTIKRQSNSNNPTGNSSNPNNLNILNKPNKIGPVK